MKRSRIPSFKAYLVTAGGKRKRVRAQEMVIEFQDGAELHLDLAPHHTHRGGLPVQAGPRLEERGGRGWWQALVIHPGAANVVHLSVRRHRARLITGG
jgi:hypothetical protein